LKGVVSASATTYDGAVVHGPKGSAYAVLRGIEQGAGEAQSLKLWLREGSLMNTSTAEPEAVIGIELANRLGTKLGDTLQVIPAGANSNPSIIPIRRVRVVGFFRSGLFEYDSTWVYIPFETASAFAGSAHAASIVSVQVGNPEDVKRSATRVKETLGNSYNTIDWQDANQPLFAALALERRMGLFIIGLIIVIAVLNITTMLILVVVERRRDIAVLSTLGAKRLGIMLVFIIEGAVVGAVGAFIGVLIGLTACAVGNQFKLVSLPADVYSISNVSSTCRLD
jgi:lipoprotein-releasing system permease protein